MRSWPSCVLWASATASRCGGGKRGNQARPENEPKTASGRPGDFLSGAFLLPGYPGKPAPAVAGCHPYSPSGTNLHPPTRVASRSLLQPQSQHQVSTSDGALHPRDASSHVEAWLPVLLRTQQEVTQQLS